MCTSGLTHSVVFCGGAPPGLGGHLAAQCSCRLPVVVLRVVSVTGLAGTRWSVLLASGVSVHLRTRALWGGEELTSLTLCWGLWDGGSGFPRQWPEHLMWFFFWGGGVRPCDDLRKEAADQQWDSFAHQRPPVNNRHWANSSLGVLLTTADPNAAVQPPAQQWPTAGTGPSLTTMECSP